MCCKTRSLNIRSDIVKQAGTRSKAKAQALAISITFRGTGGEICVSSSSIIIVAGSDIVSSDPAS
jgi:hypothetical protein